MCCKKIDACRTIDNGSGGKSDAIEMTATYFNEDDDNMRHPEMDTRPYPQDPWGREVRHPRNSEAGVTASTSAHDLIDASLMGARGFSEFSDALKEKIREEVRAEYEQNQKLPEPLSAKKTQMGLAVVTGLSWVITFNTYSLTHVFMSVVLTALTLMAMDFSGK